MLIPERSLFPQMHLTKIEATFPCRCGATMRIAMIQPLVMEQSKMLHTYTCQDCGEIQSFKFLKGEFS